MFLNIKQSLTFNPNDDIIHIQNFENLRTGIKCKLYTRRISEIHAVNNTGTVLELCYPVQETYVIFHCLDQEQPKMI